MSLLYHDASGKNGRGQYTGLWFLEWLSSGSLDLVDHTGVTSDD